MTAPPKRRWFSFSLRTMFVLMLLTACAIPTAQLIEVHYGIAKAQRKLKQMQDEMAERAKAASQEEFYYNIRYIKAEGGATTYLIEPVSDQANNSAHPPSHTGN